MNNAFDVIIAPVVTEKCNALMQEKKYTFKVNPKAGRIEIARAVEELFKVKVAKVNVMNYQGKAKRAGRTMKMGRRADWKRAIVTLAEGSIEII
ncbi:MAG: 50S ribosomal protein L23 [Lentisphaeria bacterium]|jgi:large subunit ribosomal protein L23|nr:50S ribosomal protein L23 [Lentisphaeria bacterium]MBQ9777267.1 50S ribosomal protein L23 [Lentisphaeria bacterium]